MRDVTLHQNPPTAVDLIIEIYDRKDGTMKGIVLIERGHEPYKGRKALPGGFQEMGDSLEYTAEKEAREETGLKVEIVAPLRVYSNPDRDPRGHVNAIGFVTRAYGTPHAGDDAAQAEVFSLDRIPHLLAFDHDKRIEEYLAWRETNQK